MTKKMIIGSLLFRTIVDKESQLQMHFFGEVGDDSIHQAAGHKLL